MKKFFGLLLGFILSINMVWAGNDYGFRGPLNFIQSKILEKAISVQIKKNFKAQTSVKIESYGAKALRNGVFKSARLSLNNIEWDGITVHNAELNTITENNALDISDLQNLKLLSQIKIKYSATLSNADLKNILNSNLYQSEILKMNSQLAPLLEISVGDIYCESDRLFLRLKVKTFGIKVSTICSANIEINDRSLILKDAKIDKKLGKHLSANIYREINALEPISVVLEALNNANLRVNTSCIKIVNDKIEISGIISIEKD